MNTTENTTDTMLESEEPEESSAPGDTSEKEPFSLSRFLYDVLETLAMTTCAVLLIFTFLCRIAIVDGDSMNKTLYDSDVMIVSDFEYKPQCGDIVVFSLKNEDGTQKSYVKRVIATGGQVIDIDFDTWTVTVDGKVLDESGYADFSAKYLVLSDHEYPLTVPEGHVFVMGDNRNNSLDSRSSAIGFVDERLIFGRVLVRVLPFDSFSIYTRSSETE